eukprot:Em0013g1111a
MRRNSDGGDAASSDSTRRRQEPQWKQADMWRSSDDGDAASSDRQRQEPLQSVEQHKRAILLDAIQGATSSHVSSDWARFSGHEQSPSLKSFSSSESEQSQNQEMITLLMSINGKLSHILLNKPNQFLRRKTQQWSLPRSHVMKRIGSMVLI